jgi:hypothetical protein
MDDLLPEDGRADCLFDTLSALSNLVRDLAMPVLTKQDPAAGETIGQALAAADAAIGACGVKMAEYHPSTRSAEIIPFPGT